ncbi:hypothetical protein [Methylobacterium sp. J-076]|uniref:hypothetical protein n=1 Tax=Methylobacterium sp. J-076 TaxID=2836655 RepID=UPI001FB8D5F4|nr:hypothetical protein [Methylobacterium sp. J-076]MCJ2013115.1 hypothetical protein [Methylobacterium sp. J-076]
MAGSAWGAGGPGGLSLPFTGDPHDLHRRRRRRGMSGSGWWAVLAIFGWRRQRDPVPDDEAEPDGDGDTPPHGPHRAP